MPVKPMPASYPAGRKPWSAKSCWMPDEPGERARQEEQLDLHRADRDAGCASRSRRGSDRTGLVPQSHTTQDEPHDRGGDDRHRQNPRQPRARSDAEQVPEVRDHRRVGERVGAQVHVESATDVLVPQRATDHPGHEARRDAVHHDRRHDLVGPGLHLEDRRDGRPDHAAEDAEDEHREHEQRRWQERERQGCERGRRHADDELALDADVEHAALEAHGDRERGEDQRARVREHVPEARSRRRTIPRGSRCRRPTGSRRRRSTITDPSRTAMPSAVSKASSCPPMFSTHSGRCASRTVVASTVAISGPPT